MKRPLARTQGDVGLNAPCPTVRVDVQVAANDRVWNPLAPGFPEQQERAVGRHGATVVIGEQAERTVRRLDRRPAPLG